MRALHLHSSASPRDLLAKAVELLDPAQLPPGDPLRTRWIVQPGRLWERELRRRLADGGIAAGLTFGSLRLTLERAFHLVHPARSCMDENELFWTLLGLLARHQDDPDTIGLSANSAPAQWLKVNNRQPSWSRVRMARLLTGILDDHATHRPADVLKWIKGQTPRAGDEAWMAPLARAVWGQPDQPRPLALQLGAFASAVKKAAAPPRDFPALILAVLSGAQPMAYLEALGAISALTPVHLLVLETCARGASDELTTWPLVRAKWRAAGKQPDFATFIDLQKWRIPGTLQAYWGEAGITLQQQLVDLEEILNAEDIQVEDRPLDGSPPPAGGALHLLQEDVRTTRPMRTPDTRAAVSPADTSLRLIDAGSPLRELEGVRDALRAALEQDRSLKPSDILMILADTARYAPLLPAVFGSSTLAAGENGPDGLPRIPWHLADRSLRADSDTLAALLELLDALGDRITLPVLADLLAQPAIRARLGFRQEEANSLVDLLQSAGFRWGLQASDRRDDNQPGGEDGMWTLDFALRRLAAGFAYPDSTLDPVGGDRGVTPLPGFEGLAAAQLAGFIDWAGDLEKARLEFATEQPLGSASLEPGTWLGWLRQWAPRLLDTAGDREGPSIWIARVTRQLAEGARLVPPTAAFSAAAFTTLFADAAAAFEQSLPLGQGQGGMTVASPRMARVLPAGVLAVVGLSDGAWPRQDPLSPRGLLAHPRPGDRMRREEDRLVTLEWALAAERALIWTWQGRDLHRGMDIPPSVVVGELLDVCKATFRNPGPFTDRLPMHAFHPRLFGQPAASYDAVAAEAAGRLRHPRTETERWAALPLGREADARPHLLDFALSGQLPAAWDRSAWADLAAYLVRFWKLPCQAFLRTIGVDTGEDYENLPDREALELDSLAAWALRDDVLRNLAGGTDVDADALGNRLRKAGQLPPGPAGDRAVRAAYEEAASIYHQARAAAGPGGSLSPLSAMDWKPAERLVRVTAGEARGKHLLGARLEQCVMTVLQNRSIPSLVFGRKRKSGVNLPVLEPDQARRHLQKLTALAGLGASFPLPFFPEAGALYAGGRTPEEISETFWEGAAYRPSTAPESRHPACRIAFRGVDPLNVLLPETPKPSGPWLKLVAVAGLSSATPLFPQLAETAYEFLMEKTKGASA